MASNRRLKLDKVGMRVHAAVMFAQGASVTEVATACGVSRGTAHKYKQDRAGMIKACQQSLVEHTLPLANRVRQDLIEAYADPKRRGRMPQDVRRQAHEHVMATHRAAGVYPDNQQAQVVVHEMTVDRKTLNIGAIPPEKFMMELRKLIS